MGTMLSPKLFLVPGRSIRHYKRMDLADLILYLHFSYVFTVVLPLFLIPIGAALGWRWVRSRPIRILHLAMMAVVVVETALGVVCPLTWLENTLRGQTSDRGFVSMWVAKLMFYDFPPWVFATLYLVIFALIVALWLLVPPRKRL